jgi:Putative peptidoglycan binding domain
MQVSRHPTRRALDGDDGTAFRQLNAMPPVKDPEMQAWLSPLSVTESDRPQPTPTVSRIQSSSTLRGVGMSAIAALAVGALTWTMLPQSQPTTGGLVADSGANLEASIVPAAGNDDATATTPLTDPASVEEIERLLKSIAFDPGPVDGVMDSTTENAIREFEKAAGQEPTGQPTLALLDELRAVAQDLNGN